jgi:hypothetical protein
MIKSTAKSSQVASALWTEATVPGAGGVVEANVMQQLSQLSQDVEHIANAIRAINAGILTCRGRIIWFDLPNALPALQTADNATR